MQELSSLLVFSIKTLSDKTIDALCDKIATLEKALCVLGLGVGGLSVGGLGVGGLGVGGLSVGGLGVGRLSVGGLGVGRLSVVRMAWPEKSELYHSPAVELFLYHLVLPCWWLSSCHSLYRWRAVRNRDNFRLLRYPA